MVWKKKEPLPIGKRFFSLDKCRGLKKEGGNLLRGVPPTKKLRWRWPPEPSWLFDTNGRPQLQSQPSHCPFVRQSSSDMHNYNFEGIKGKRISYLRQAIFFARRRCV